jgi:hypothetical protein
LKGKVVLSTLGIMVSTLYCRISSIENFIQKFKDNDKIVFDDDQFDDDIAGKQFLKKKFSFIFQAVSAVPKEIYSGSLPTTIVLDKYGVMRFMRVSLIMMGKSLIYR